MNHELRIFDDAETLAKAASDYVAELSRNIVDRGDTFSFALSGGKTPWLMFEQLANDFVQWDHTRIFQVDERVVGPDDDLRNLKGLRASLLGTSAPIEAMDVDHPDLDEACRSYAALLPERFDLIHLGLGPDGHCASLIPGDPVLEVTDRLVAMSGPYQDTMRMTLTYPALARGNQLLWLVSGEDKREALEKLLDSDPSIPAGRVEAGASLIMADRAARGA
ncbi:MAG TPA: 6-phosphogluconolactonase [Acidimicrobiales bacterium]|nr:6-phosphogluconolactonase [Acidimicrobiales bacterium]